MSFRYRELRLLDKEKVRFDLYDAKPLAIEVHLENSSLFFLNSYEAQEGAVLKASLVEISNSRATVKKSINSV